MIRKFEKSFPLVCRARWDTRALNNQKKNHLKEKVEHQIYYTANICLNELQQNWSSKPYNDTMWQRTEQINNERIIATLV